MDNLAEKLLDLVGYGVGVTVAATLVGAVVSLGSGGGWVPVKFALFFIGFALFGYASIALWRAASLEPDEPEGGFETAARDRTPFESLLARIAPPLDGIAPPEERLSPSVKLFVASLLVLGLSVSMEMLFGVE